MNPRKLRWGIMSTAEIARKNWKAIQLAGNYTVTAVASRNLERCRRFIAECQEQAPMENIPQALGGYDKLLVTVRPRPRKLTCFATLPRKSCPANLTRPGRTSL
jgi:hypothetical protein